MTDAGNTPNTDQTDQPEDKRKPAKESTVDRKADQAAKRAGNREKEYDKNHPIFTE